MVSLTDEEWSLSLKFPVILARQVSRLSIISIVFSAYVIKPVIHGGQALG
jgi:hypothetical protein